MIELLQNSNNLIGAPQAIENLKKTEHARILVISDSHGNYRTLVRILNQFGPSCDAFIFCGDGARDICEILEKANEDEKFRKNLPSVMAFVRGNGDSEFYPVSYEIGKNNLEARTLPKGSVIFPLSQTICVNNKNIFISHGHYQTVDFGRTNLANRAMQENCQIAFYGHTHIANEEMIDDVKVVNPGSCSRPRGGQSAGFAICTVEKDFLDVAFIRVDDFKIYSPIF